MCITYEDFNFQPETLSERRLKTAEAILRLDEQFPDIDSARLYEQVNVIESIYVSGARLPFHCHKENKYYRVRVVFNAPGKPEETKYFIECNLPTPWKEHR